MRPGLFPPCLLLFPSLVQAAPHSQSPDAAWITYTTAHYRIHCPKIFEAFGDEVAGRVEGIHARYLDLVGFVYEKPIDILILDPVLEANGMALPVLQRPHGVLWKTEPEPDSTIGHHHGWAELLLAHELGHMHHLLRPARKPGLWERWTAGVGPLTRKSPRWVIEGYATLIEGRLTGSGRPHSAIRASVLRQWAIEGKLPTYEALSGQEGFLSSSMAYLEQAVVWDDVSPRPAAQRVAGLEIDSRNLGLPLDVLRRLAGNLSFTLGVHRPLDGVMKGRTVGTLSLILRP